MFDAEVRKLNFPFMNNFRLPLLLPPTQNTQIISPKLFPFENNLNVTNENSNTMFDAEIMIEFSLY